MDRETIQRMAGNLWEFLKATLVLTAFGTRRFCDVMAPHQRKDFDALNASLQAVARGTVPPVRRFWIERTKGGSKDSDLAYCILYLLVFSGRTLRIQIGAYDQAQATEILLIIKQILAIDDPLHRLLASVIQVQATKIIVAGIPGIESTAEFLTTDSRGSHGSRPDVVIVNELSHVANEEFASTLLDNADKVPNSLVIIATNAGYLDTWQYNWHVQAAESPRWYFSALTDPSPWVDPLDLEESKRRNSAARYNRLWAGQWVRNEGDAIDAADLAAAITIERDSLTSEGDEIFVGGLDLSTKRDHSAFVVLGADWRRHRVRLAFCRSWKPGPSGVDLQVVRDDVGKISSDFGCAVAYDPTQCELLASDLRTEWGVNCVPMPFTGPACNKMASCLVQGFKERRIDLWDEPELISDLGRLSIVEKSFGYKLEATHDPNRGHADRAFALCIALPPAMEIATTYIPNDNVMRIGGSLCSN